MPRDVIVFESNAFSFEGEHRQEVDLPPGMDVAAHLRVPLQNACPNWTVGEPFAGDVGAFIPINTPRSPVTTLVTVHRTAINGKRNCWAVSFQQAEGCLRTLLRFLLGGEMDPKALELAKDFAEKAIWSDSERFVHPEWLADTEYRHVLVRNARHRK